MVHKYLMDTSFLYPSTRGASYRRSLKELTQTLLGRNIQEGHGTTGHDSEQVSRDVYSCFVFTFVLIDPIGFWNGCLIIWLGRSLSFGISYDQDDQRAQFLLPSESRARHY